MKNIIIFFLCSYSLLIASNEIDLQNKNIEIKIINPKNNKTKDDYEKKINLLEEPQTKTQEVTSKKESISIDGEVDFDEETKSIDSVNINLGTKF